MNDSTPKMDGDDGDLHDPMLQRALHNAPDSAAAPDARLGESIRAMAHEAVAPSLPEGLVGAQRPWWQRFLGIGAGGGRMPRNAAFATVLLAVLVTTTWHQQEIPDARLDSTGPSAESSRKEQAARDLAPTAPALTPAPASPATPAPSSAPGAEMAKPAPAPAAEPPPPTPAPSTLEAALAESRALADAAARALEKEEQARQRQAARVRQGESDAAAALARLQGRPPPSALTPPPPVRAPVAAMPPTVAAAPPAAPGAQPSIVAPPTRALEANANSAFAKRGAANAESAGGAPGESKMRADASAAPNFNALSQWTRLRISRAGGDSRSLARAEARDLGALVGSAALAGVGAQPLSSSADWRIALERNGEVLAVLELAGGQVRWRENGVAPGTGSPGAGALAALREALEEAAAAAPPSAPAAPPPAPPPAAPAR